MLLQKNAEKTRKRICEQSGNFIELGKDKHTWLRIKNTVDISETNKSGRGLDIRTGYRKQKGQMETTDRITKKLDING